MQPNESDIYEEHVLDHYEDPYHRGTLQDPTHHHAGDNPLCGDTVALDLKIDRDGVIREAFFDGDGCVISQASASMLVEKIEGKPIDELESFTAQSMLELFGPKLTPNRQKCCLLPWRVLQSAVHSPVDDDDESELSSDSDSSARGKSPGSSIRSSFGGPTLGDES